MAKFGDYSVSSPTSLIIVPRLRHNARSPPLSSPIRHRHRHCSCGDYKIHGHHKIDRFKEMVLRIFWNLYM
ncbi:hypothetical protein ACMD2_03474 [Ananas comosus]|uniref:Uncharacterized protein n=1 Tax=Ananas comosus TaxID=4615 RepID=A0A199VHN4_ANACO|nr:hypothetical protein ACMD2_03474 [Ananas comosus]